MLRGKLISAFASAILSAVVAYTASPAAASEMQVEIKFDTKLDERPVMVAYVKGALAGVVPGSLMVLRDKVGVAVEIGIKQLRPSPLYSFVLGQKEFDEQAVEVVLTSLIFGNFGEKGDKGSVFLTPNTKQSIPLKKIGPDVYSLVLPAYPYSRIAKYWEKSAGQSKSGSELGKLSTTAYSDMNSGADHRTYSQSKSKTVYLKYGSDAEWSGARNEGHFASYGISGGLGLDRENWTIISSPPGATIYTDEGPKGLTTSTISIAKTGSMFVVLQKDGFQQCVQKDCKAIQTTDGTVLTCDLKKMRSAR